MKRVITGDMWTEMGSAIASFMFMWAMFRQYIPYQLHSLIETYINRLIDAFYPYVKISFPEYTSNSLDRRNEAFSLVETYISSKANLTQVKRLKAKFIKNKQPLDITLDDYQEVTDTFNGIKVWWSSTKSAPTASSQDVQMIYLLTFHRRYQDVVTKSYLNHVLQEGKAIKQRNRQRKLFTNGAGETWSGYNKNIWSHVAFEHPATFETLAMDPKKKEEIVDDLITFTESKDYYGKIGKTWKRGYLLYGPPGTGKSTMIAAMANLLCYDVYDLELTAVQNNTELRKLLIQTSSKSIIVIEDIDCSLDLTGQRKKVKDLNTKDDKLIKDGEKEKTGSKVTLSGLLNIIDGLWSSSEGERIVVFTTNFVDKLDPALTRKGRMDKHIEMSYCRFKAFKVLVKNYWDVDEHPVFDTVKTLLEETDMTPADVSENLMPKSSKDDAETCLATLVEALQVNKEASSSKPDEQQELE